MKNLLLFFMFAVITLASCWHQQNEDRLASGDTRNATNETKSSTIDTTASYGRDYSDNVNYNPGNGPDGRKIYNEKCAQCHGDNRSTLGNILERIPNLNWAHDFVHDADSLIKKGDGYSKMIYSEYQNRKHPKFPELSAEDINAILTYVDRLPLNNE